LRIAASSAYGELLAMTGKAGMGAKRRYKPLAVQVRK